MTIGLSMIMLTSDAPLHAAEFEKHLATFWPDMPEVTDVEEKDETLSLHVADADVIMARMPGPIPWSQLEGPCATSILWKNAEKEVKAHTIHWIITINAELDPIPMSILLTRATAAAMAACEGAIGVYWGNSTLVIPKPIFNDFTEKVLPHGPPLYIWVDFRVGRDSERTSSGFTQGLEALGHMEFEAESCPEPPGELRERFVGLAGYVIDNGPVINDGDTIGEDADERIRVVYSKSAFGNEGQVMRLVYETASKKKPWWKFW